MLIKPSLSKLRNEPADVLNYAIQNPTFPHQSTADQFFDESQFESFRRLGKWIGDSCLADSKVLKLLEIRKPAPFREPNRQDEEGRSHFTQLIGSILDRPKEQQPGRDGSLVDLFIEMVLITTAYALMMMFLDYAVFKISSEFCWTLANCAASVPVLPAQTPVFAFGATVGDLRLMLDNVFVLLYMVTFILGYRVGLGDNRRIWLAACLPVTAALCDYSENFLLLSNTSGVYAILPAVTLVKFWGFALSGVLLVLLLLAIARRFCKRWF